MKKSIVFIALGLLVFAACKKSETPAVYNIDGLWMGHYGNGDSGVIDRYYAFAIKPCGLITVEADDSVSPGTAHGTWTLVGDSFKTTYSYINSGPTYSAVAKFDKNVATLNGTWGPGTNNSGGGRFHMDLQK